MTADPTQKTVEPFAGPLEVDVPMPVSIVGTVNTRRRWRRAFRTGTATFSTPTESTQIVGADERRGSLVIFNPSTQTVYLVAQRTDSVGNGFPLLAGASFAMDHQAAVFGWCPTALATNQATVAYAIESRTD